MNQKNKIMKTAVFVLCLVFLSSYCISQQTVSGVSKPGYVNISKDPPKPPYLEVVQGSLQFIDNDGNDKIDALGETAIRFQLKNSGLGPGLNLKVITKENNLLNGLLYPKSLTIGTLDVNDVKNCEIPVSGNMDLSNSRASFTIIVEEANGFNSDPFSIEIETRAFRAPVVKVVDYKVSSQNSTTLQKRKPFDLQILIQNVGEGTANNVRARIPVPENMWCLSANEDILIGDLKAGETFLVEYQFVTNNEYDASTIPFNIKISEKTGRFAENKDILLSMNQGISTEKLIVQGKQESGPVIEIGSLTSDVDKNIPDIGLKYSDRIALIIGNEDYSHTLNSEVNVKYARNDAEIFRQYATHVLGVEEKNIHFLLDATAGQMKREIDLVSAIMEKLGSNAELIFYYAGHGLPDESSRAPYLIPVDVDATNLGSAIKLAEIYKKFGKTGARRVTVFLDACFSGGGRGKGLLTARAVAIKPKSEPILGNMVVFSATTGEQSALPYNAEKHGMFTYYLLKKLQESKGMVSYGDLADYLKKEVGLESLRENGKPQDPEVNVSSSVTNSWEEWEIR